MIRVSCYDYTGILKLFLYNIIVIPLIMLQTIRSNHGTNSNISQPAAAVAIPTVSTTDPVAIIISSGKHIKIMSIQQKMRSVLFSE